MRRAVPLLAVLSLAFAPAPVYRPERDRKTIDLDRFQGTWKVVGHHSWANNAKQSYLWSITHVRVKSDAWILLESGAEKATYRIELHASKTPCHIDWRGEKKEALWLGAIRRDGDKVEIVYQSANSRPESFDAPPNGTTMISLERER